MYAGPVVFPIGTREQSVMSATGGPASAGSQLPASVGLGAELESWKECRATIGRFDNLLADTRKYGFTLITLLLTASALTRAVNVQVDRLAVFAVVSALILVLFWIDRYYWFLQQVSVDISMKLEELLLMRGAITKGLRVGVKKSVVHFYVLAAYPGFVLVALLVTLISEASLVSKLIATAVAAAILVAMSLARWWLARKLDPAISAAVKATGLTP